MNFTLNQLYIFQKVAEHQSITKAAEALHLTQPAVSIQLKNFQEQFKLPLTEIIGRQLYLTEFGTEIAYAAERILDEVNAINFKSLEFGGQLVGRLKIAVVSTGKYVMPYFLSDFIRNNPGVELIMDVTNKTRVLKNLEKNEVDLALVSVLPKHFSVNQEYLLPNKLFLVGSAKHLYPIEPNKPEHLSDVPLIFRESGSATRMAMEDYLATHKIRVTKKMELTSNEAVKQAVTAGLGLSIMPLIGIKEAVLNKELKIFEMADLPIITEWNLIWMPSKKFSPVTSAFLNYISNEKDRITKEAFGWFLKNEL